MTNKEYNKLVRTGSRGEYPRILTTTDGKTFNQEFYHNYDQWKPDGRIVVKIRNSDDWPTLSQAITLSQ